MARSFQFGLDMVIALMVVNGIALPLNPTAVSKETCIYSYTHNYADPICTVHAGRSRGLFVTVTQGS